MNSDIHGHNLSYLTRILPGYTWSEFAYLLDVKPETTLALNVLTSIPTSTSLVSNFFMARDCMMSMKGWNSIQQLKTIDIIEILKGSQ